MEISNLFNNNVYENVTDRHLYNQHTAANNGYNNNSITATSTTTSVEKSVETNGFVLNLDNPYYVFCEQDKVTNEELIKPLIDYSMTNLYEPLNYINKQNMPLYANMQQYNNFLYPKMIGNAYRCHTTSAAQHNINGYGDETVPHAYNGIIQYDTNYPQQYNNYHNYSTNIDNYRNSNNYSCINDQNCETESSGHSDTNKSCKDIISTEDHSANDDKSDSRESNSINNLENIESDLPFGNLISKYNDIDSSILLSNEISTQSNDTIQSIGCQQNLPSTPIVSGTGNVTAASTTDTPNIKHLGYNNYYYGYQTIQPIKSPVQNMQAVNYKETYPQQIYNNQEMPMENIYNWNWPLYKMPQNIYQQNMYASAGYQNIYNPRSLYKQTLEEKWKMGEIGDKRSRGCIKRSKNSSAGRPRLNRSDYACSKCRARSTPQWRYLHGVAVCNACYMRARKEKMRMVRS